MSKLFQELHQLKLEYSLYYNSISNGQFSSNLAELSNTFEMYHYIKYQFMYNLYHRKSPYKLQVKFEYNHLLYLLCSIRHSLQF